jgi:hypothetical protein
VCAKKESDVFRKVESLGIGKETRGMKRILILLFLTLVLTDQASKAADNSEYPKWIHELLSVAVKTFQTEVSISHVKLPDNLEEGKYFTFCLKGNGTLGKTSDPFETMERMFTANNWKYVARYQADGHGSSSFAYEKEKRLCNIHVNIDSSCDDEETGHVPSEFWFEIYCRDK